MHTVHSTQCELCVQFLIPHDDFSRAFMPERKSNELVMYTHLSLHQEYICISPLVLKKGGQERNLLRLISIITQQRGRYLFVLQKKISLPSPLIMLYVLTGLCKARANASKFKDKNCSTVIMFMPA